MPVHQRGLDESSEYVPTFIEQPAGLSTKLTDRGVAPLVNPQMPKSVRGPSYAVSSAPWNILPQSNHDRIPGGWEGSHPAVSPTPPPSIPFWEPPLSR